MQRERLNVKTWDIETAKTVSMQHPDYQEAVFTAVLAALLVTKVREPDEPRVKALPSGTKELTSVELFAALRPASDVNKVLLAGFWLETKQGLQIFTTDQLKASLIGAKVKPPANVSLAVLRNAEKGLMAPAGNKQGGKSGWFVTQTGSEKVKQWLDQKEHPETEK